MIFHSIFIKISRMSSFSCLFELAVANSINSSLKIQEVSIWIKECELKCKIELVSDDGLVCGPYIIFPSDHPNLGIFFVPHAQLRNFTKKANLLPWFCLVLQEHLNVVSCIKSILIRSHLGWSSRHSRTARHYLHTTTAVLPTHYHFCIILQILHASILATWALHDSCSLSYRWRSIVSSARHLSLFLQQMHILILNYNDFYMLN